MPHKFLLAALLAVYGAHLHAATSDSPGADYTIEEVIVTATRFEETDPKTAGNVFVLTRNDINRLPAASVPDLLAGLPGVTVAPLYGALGIDSVVNLRGAGTVGTAVSNTLVLLNGQRLNPIDSGSIDWSLIPMASIERIEVMPGSGTVIYGDRATGGVINIVTRKVVDSRGIEVGLGSDGMREISAQTGWQADDVMDVNLYAQYGANDGWRVNSDQERYALGGRVGFGRSLETRGFVELSAFSEKLGMPGGLWRVDYESDPTQSIHPGDRSDRQGFRIRPGLEMALSSNVDFEADLTLSRDNRRGYSDATNPTEQVRDLDRDFVSFSPKIRASYALGGIHHKATFGYEYYQGSTDSETSPVGKREYAQQAKQSSHALYLQNTSDLTEHWFLTLGARTQRLHQTASQSEFDKTCYDENWAPYPCVGQAMSGRSTDTRQAYEAGLVYREGDWRFYGRAGSIFRFPNTDELFGLDPLTYDPYFAAVLKPQHGMVYEVGGAVRTAAVSFSLALFQQDIKDEITSSDPTDYYATGNMNLTETRRRGIELNSKIRLADTLRARAGFVYQQAEVTDGQYAGSQLPLVPKIQAGAGLSWEPTKSSVYSARLNYVGKRRYGDDYYNTAGYLDGYATLDLQANWKMFGWGIEAKILNATDKKYAAFGGYGFSSLGYDTFYYPADGRTFRLVASHDF